MLIFEGYSPQTYRTKICLLGASLENGNFGVQALAASLIDLLLKFNPNAEISLLYGGRKGVCHEEIIVGGRSVKIDLLNFRLSPKAHPKFHLICLVIAAFFYNIIRNKKVRQKIIEWSPLLNALSASDLIGDVRGGDSFSDIYGMGRFIMGSLPILIVFLLKKKVVLLPQTYGPFSSRIAKSVAKFIFKHSARIYARDWESIDYARNILGNKQSKTIAFCPDVAFTLSTSNKDELSIVPPLNPDGRPIVGININGLLYNGGYTQNNMFGLLYDYKIFIHELTRKFLEKTNAGILLVPHTRASNDWHVESDLYACRDLAKHIKDEYKGRIHVAAGQYTTHEIKGIIGICNFFVGSRMHACIAAISQGVPTVPVGYSRKFKGVFESIGLTDIVLDGRLDDMNKTISFIVEEYTNRDGKTHAIYDAVEQAKCRVNNTFRELVAGKLD